MVVRNRIQRLKFDVSRRQAANTSWQYPALVAVLEECDLPSRIADCGLTKGYIVQPVEPDIFLENQKIMRIGFDRNYPSRVTRHTNRMEAVMAPHIEHEVAGRKHAVPDKS